MKKRNKKKWREANYYIGWLFVLVYVAIQFLYQYQLSNEVSAHGIISPVPSSYSDELANQLYLVYEPPAEEEIKVEETEKELIEFYADKFKVDPDYIKCIIWLESRNNTFAKGDQGTSWGLAQFKESTFRAFRRLMGLDENPLLRQDKAEAIKTLCFAIKEGKDSHWSVVTSGLCRK